MPTSIQNRNETFAVRYVNEATQVIKKWPEAASQSFKAGDVLLLNSDGRVAIAATAGNSVAANVILLGVAMQDATGTTDTLLDVAEFTAGMQLRLPVYHSTPASAVTARTDLLDDPAGNPPYRLFDLRNNSASTGWMVDIEAAQNDASTVMKCEEIDRQYPVGEQYGTCWWSVNLSLTAGDTTRRNQ